MRGGLGGALELTTGYARNPLRVTDGSQHLPVVSDQAFTDFGFAATYDRWRVYLDMAAPLVTQARAAPSATFNLPRLLSILGSHPDTLSDPRIGVDARILGGPRGPFRLGAGAQLLVPNGNRSDYDTDGTFRGMLRVLAAGDLGPFTYAAQLGVHIRPLDDAPAPGSPRGSELLFGAAAGARFPATVLGPDTALVVGPEIYGESAFTSFFGTTATGLEGLMTGRLEGTADRGPQVRVKVGAGGGLDPHFGAPEWRVVLGVELFDHRADGEP